MNTNSKQNNGEWNDHKTYISSTNETVLTKANK